MHEFTTLLRENIDVPIKKDENCVIFTHEMQLNLVKHYYLYPRKFVRLNDDYMYRTCHKNLYHFLCRKSRKVVLALNATEMCYMVEHFATFIDDLHTIDSIFDQWEAYKKICEVFILTKRGKEFYYALFDIAYNLIKNECDFTEKLFLEKLGTISWDDLRKKLSYDARCHKILDQNIFGYEYNFTMFKVAAGDHVYQLLTDVLCIPDDSF